MRYYRRWYYINHSYTFVPMKKDKHLVKLGNQIREVRKSKNLSQEQLAYDAGIDRSYMGSIERGERNVGFLTLVKIADCLGSDVGKFTNGIPK